MRVNLQGYATAIIAAVFLLAIWQVLGRWQFSISVEPLESETPSVERVPKDLSVVKPTAVSLPNPTPTPTVTKPKTPAKPLAAEAGILRVSNHTQHPVRLALRPKLQGIKQSSNQSEYAEAAHWDFAPGEGGTRGLLLALPDGNLKLNRGDILVAFAQDGSRRYWGPYVVGETPGLIWNAQSSEWQLILQP